MPHLFDVNPSATDHLHIVTGPPGAGKSTLVAALAARGVATSGEVGRRVLREQLAVGGNALPWGDERAFADLMLPGEVAAHADALALGTTVVLDRGVPDVAGFLLASGLSVPPELDAAMRERRYNPRVFFAPFWPEVFVGDAERPLGEAAYRRSEAALRRVYGGLGYRLVDLPFAPAAERAAFVLAELRT